MRSVSPFKIFITSLFLIFSTLLPWLSSISGEEKAKKVISFSKDIQPILTNNCATKDCHTGPKPAKKMDLSEGKAYQNLVNVTSVEVPRKKRVMPGNVEKSYLFDKITGNQDEGDRMPSGKKSLPRKQIELIRAWIRAGASSDTLPAMVSDSLSRSAQKKTSTQKNKKNS